MADLFERLAKGRPPSVEAKQPHKDPAQKLLDWLQRWNKPTITVRQIRIYGPHIIKDQRSAIDAAEILVKNGWLNPVKKPFRRDRIEWQIIRTPTLSPTVER
jgi:hypothetical protein